MVLQPGCLICRSHREDATRNHSEGTRSPRDVICESNRLNIHWSASASREIQFSILALFRNIYVRRHQATRSIKALGMD